MQIEDFDIHNILRICIIDNILSPEIPNLHKNYFKTSEAVGPIGFIKLFNIFCYN